MIISVPATYGHGTHNDFVIIFDPEDQRSVTTAQTQAICNRVTGVGADGLIRILKRDGKWFMDYRNSDGSLAEMCGNGIRVMAKYLVVHGHQAEGIFAINTRDGIKHLRVPAEGDISVNMGKVVDESEEITASNNGHIWNGFNINAGNPHAVVFTDDLVKIGDLKTAPQVSPADEYPDGVNVEFAQFLENGEINMRVYERGVGETQSCGTGICAIALAATIEKKKRVPIKWIINPPGGKLVVEIDGHNNATLTGAAELVKEVELDQYL